MNKSIEIIRPGELSEKLKLSKPTLWRMEQRGDLPKRVILSERAVGWLKSDIEQWLESKKEVA